MSHVLVVDDDIDAAESLAARIAAAGHSVAQARGLQEARRHLAMQAADLVLLGTRLPDGPAHTLFDDAELLGRAEVVVVAGDVDGEAARQALRRGATTCLAVPVAPAALLSVLARKALPAAAVRGDADAAAWTREWERSGSFGGLRGRTAAMQRLHRQIARVAATSVSVLVHGESGTGKEVVAQAVHALSRRRRQPLLAVNCGAVSPTLIESEIFGHEKGSFTGAERQHQGFFERAHGGTLFLDEVTEMSPALQVKLLRVLETGRFMRVGSTQALETDVRVIAATNRPPRQAIAEGKLREDLYYRLAVFPIALPPLRDRADDVPLLAEHFLREIAQREGTPRRFTAAALRRLAAHRWPGNVRELRNVVQRAYVMADGDSIDEEWLPGGGGDEAWASFDPVGAEDPDEARGPELRLAIGTSLADAERRLTLATLRHCGDRREAAAATLGISPKTLANRLKDYASGGAAAAVPTTSGDPAGT